MPNLVLEEEKTELNKRTKPKLKNKNNWILPHSHPWKQK